MATAHANLTELLADPDLQPALRELARIHCQMLIEVWRRRHAELAEQAATTEEESA